MNLDNARVFVATGETGTRIPSLAGDLRSAVMECDGPPSGSTPLAESCTRSTVTTPNEMFADRMIANPGREEEMYSKEASLYNCSCQQGQPMGPRVDERQPNCSCYGAALDILRTFNGAPHFTWKS